MKHINDIVHIAEYIEDDVAIISYTYAVGKMFSLMYDDCTNMTNVFNNSLIMHNPDNAIRSINMNKKDMITIDVVKGYDDAINKYLEYLDSIVDMYVNGDGSDTGYISLYKLGIIFLNYDAYNDSSIIDITIKEVKEDDRKYYICTYYLKPNNIWKTLFPDEYSMKLHGLIPIRKVTKDSISYKMACLNINAVAEIAEVLDMYIKINKKLNIIKEEVSNNVRSKKRD